MFERVGSLKAAKKCVSLWKLCFLCGMQSRVKGCCPPEKIQAL